MIQIVKALWSLVSWIPRHLIRMSIGELSLLSLALLAMMATGVYWMISGNHGSRSVSAVPVKVSDGVQAVCLQVPHALPQPTRALRPTLVLPLCGDRQELVTQTLRNTLASHGAYSPVSESVMDRIWDGLAETVGNSRHPISDVSEALELGVAADAEVVMFGLVERLVIHESHVEVAFRLRVFEVDGGNQLFDGQFASRPTKQYPLARSTPALVLAGLLAFAFLWPPCTIPLMRRVLKLDSNAATLATILLITAVPTILAVPLVFDHSMMVLRIIILVAGAIATGLWCMTVMAWLVDE